MNSEELKRYPYVQPDHFWPKSALAAAFILGLLTGLIVVTAAWAVFS